MRKFLAALLLIFPLAVFGDARVVEAPAECHFPTSNIDNNIEYKAVGCSVGAINQRPNTGVQSETHVFVENAWIYPDGSRYTIYVPPEYASEYSENWRTGYSWDTDYYDSGGTPCNLVEANGAQTALPKWRAVHTITPLAPEERTSPIEVKSTLECWDG